MNDKFDELAKGMAQSVTRRGALKKFGVGLAGIAALALWATASDCAGQTYTITDLGTLGGTNSQAYGINNFGQVVGISLDVGSYKKTIKICEGGGYPGAHCDSVNATFAEQRAFLWTPTQRNGTNGSLIDLGTLGGPSSTAYSINRSGQVVGYGDTHDLLTWGNVPADPYDHHGFLWSPDTANGTQGSLSDLTILFSSFIEPVAINASGAILDDEERLWQNGTLMDLGGMYAWGINDFSEVVGSSIIDGFEHAFIWQNGVKTDLGTLPGDDFSYARDINTNGQVVGVSGVYDAASGSLLGASGFLFIVNSSGAVTARTALGASFVPARINNFGQVLGYSHPSNGVWQPMLWDSVHGLRDSADLIPSNSGWVLREVNGINDAGQIVGLGVSPTGQLRACLLTPLPAPWLTSPTRLANGQFQFTLVGDAGRSYTIQASTDLATWTALTNLVSATGTNQFTDPAAADSIRQFYRAVTR